MMNKVKSIIALTVFLLALFFSLGAEPVRTLSNKADIEDVVKKVYPAVVKVIVINGIQKEATGVVIDKEGVIVTHALISPRDEKIYVTTYDGKRHKAKFLGMDSETHLALIQVKGKKLPTITIGSDKDLGLGSWIGIVSIYPEKTPAITQGIVSSRLVGQLLLNVWVVPGMSGSPVIDKKGHMVGLLRGVFTDEKPLFFEFREKKWAGTGYVFSKAEAPSSGLALAVPIDIVKKVTSEIKTKGKVERGWLGVIIGINEEGQVEIFKVDEESPAELAKLKEGDVILEFEGKDVTDYKMLGREIKQRKPGVDVTLKINRDEKTKEIKVKLGELSEKTAMDELESKFPGYFAIKPKKMPRAPKLPKPESKVFSWSWESRKFIGVYLDEISQELSEHFGVKKGKGLLISKFGEDSPAEKAGLKVGDVIVKADGERVESIRELSKAIQEKEKGEKVNIEFFRDKKQKSVDVEVTEEEKGEFPEGALYFSDNWNRYVDSWDHDRDKLNKESKKWKDKYSEDFKEQMKILDKKLKEIRIKSKDTAKDAAKKVKIFVKRKGIKV